MTIDKNHVELWWISLIVRIAMASLFFVAALSKFMMGLDAMTAHILTTFKDTILPSWMLSPYATILPFAEALIPVWLLTGYKLRAGWVFTAFLLVTLAFGLSVSKQSAADVYIYLLVACLGLYLSRYDRCVLGGKKK